MQVPHILQTKNKHLDTTTATYGLHKYSCHCSSLRHEGLVEMSVSHPCAAEVCIITGM